MICRHLCDQKKRHWSPNVLDSKIQLGDDEWKRSGHDAVFERAEEGGHGDRDDDDPEPFCSGRSAAQQGLNFRPSMGPCPWKW